MKLNPAARDVEAHLSDVSRTAKEIWRLVDCWSPTGVRHALDELVKFGAAERIQETIPSGGFRYRYRRAA